MTAPDPISLLSDHKAGLLSHRAGLFRLACTCGAELGVVGQGEAGMHQVRDLMHRHREDVRAGRDDEAAAS